MKKALFVTIGVAIFVGLIGLSLYLGERFTRYYYRDITTTADNSSYFSRHWYLKVLGRDRVLLNSLGFRDPEPSLSKQAGDFRIVVVGDSYTFGQGIDQAKRFTDRLQVIVDDLGLPFEIINFGRNGAGPVNYIKESENYLQYQPDYVLIQWLANDFELATKDPRFARPKPKNLIPVRFDKYHYNHHKHSTLYYVLNRGFHNLQINFGFVETYHDYMNRRYQDAEGEENIRSMRHFSQMIEVFDSKEHPVGLVLFPLFVDGLGTNEYPFGYFHDRMTALCTRTKIDCLDLKSSYDDQADAISTLTVNAFDGHPSALANEIAAEEIAAYFVPIWKRMQATDQ